MSSYMSLVELLLALWICYVVYSAFERLYLSPIAKFPGPKLAALTRLYELYYEIVKGGQFTFKIGELHKQYGPIIRINPWELHINDPEYYEELCAGAGKKRDKYLYYTEQFGNPKSMIGTVPHDLHRIRRAPLNRFFSKASVLRLLPLIQSKVDKLCSRLREFQESGKAVSISLAFACFTNDVVSEYAFARSYDYLGTSKDFHTDIHDALVSVSEVSHVLKQIPWAIAMMQKVPERVMRILNPKILSFLTFQKDMATQIRSIMTGENSNHKSASHPTIFHDILESNLPPEEKELDRLWQEGQTVIGAGTETTAWTLSVIIYHVLANPDIHDRLQSELTDVFLDAGGSPSFNRLETLPYLSAVVSEGLRLSFGVTTHLQRVSPDQPMMFKDWTIPPGTPTGMTSVLQHLNPEIFPHPTEFLPERWLANPRLSRYLVSFSKGSRQCLGMNLAYAEIYLCLAHLLYKFPDILLSDTGKEDVEIVADYYAPKASGRGVKVLLNCAVPAL